jgi:hypothetical protein
MTAPAAKHNRLPALSHMRSAEKPDTWGLLVSGVDREEHT